MSNCAARLVSTAKQFKERNWKIFLYFRPPTKSSADSVIYAITSPKGDIAFNQEIWPVAGPDSILTSRDHNQWLTFFTGA